MEMQEQKEMMEINLYHGTILTEIPTHNGKLSMLMENGSIYNIPTLECH